MLFSNGLFLVSSFLPFLIFFFKNLNFPAESFFHVTDIFYVPCCFAHQSRWHFLLCCWLSSANNSVNSSACLIFLESIDQINPWNLHLDVCEFPEELWPFAGVILFLLSYCCFLRCTFYTFGFWHVLRISCWTCQSFFLLFLFHSVLLGDISRGGQEWLQTYYIAKCKHWILLPQPPQFYSYSCVHQTGLSHLLWRFWSLVPVRGERAHCHNSTNIKPFKTQSHSLAGVNVDAVSKRDNEGDTEKGVEMWRQPEEEELCEWG